MDEMKIEEKIKESIKNASDQVLLYGELNGEFQAFLVSKEILDLAEEAAYETGHADDLEEEFLEQEEINERDPSIFPKMIRWKVIQSNSRRR